MTLAVALSAALFVIASTRVGAANQLSNPGFESWVGSVPEPWFTTGSVGQDAGASGSGARLTAAGSGSSLVSDFLEVAPGFSVAGQVEIRGDSTASVIVQFRWYNDDLVLLTPTNGPPAVAGEAWATASNTAVAPPSAAWVELVLRATGSGFVTLDNASLEITAPPPTATPTWTPTPTETPETPDDPVPGTATTPAGTTPAGGNPQTPGATATRTPTPTRTPTGTRTPTKEPTNTRTPTLRPGVTRAPTSPLSTSTPTLPAGSSFGGMLANGDFELVRDGKPAYWEKFGGTLIASGEAARGSYAACLESDTSSVKWLYQVVAVEGGAWYAATADGRVDGSGTASIRVSWYASADASGSQLDFAESNLASGAGWAALATGPVQAPDSAQSARVRLTLQPGGNATACFDDATFDASAAPAPTAVPAGSTAQATVRAMNTPRPGSTATVPGQRFVPSASGASTPTAGGGELVSAGLRLSEVLSDPVEPGRDADFEWVELVNVSDADIDTAGWQLADGTAARALPAAVIPPGGYFVVRGASASLPANVTSGVSPGGEIGNGLGNTGDVIQLLGPGGSVADVMSFGDNREVFDPAPEPPGAGETLGVIDPAADPASENWAVTLRPTPGEPNVFLPKPVATVAGVRQPAPGDDSGSGSNPTEVTEGDGGGGRGIASWLVLGAIGGISLGVGASKLGPRLLAQSRRLRAS